MRLSNFRALVLVCLAGLIALATPSVSAADEPDAPWYDTLLKESPDGDFWRVFVAPYTAHFHKDEEGLHQNVYLVGIERQFANGWLLGAAYFSNSFGQSSGYFYGGERVFGWSPWPELFFEWTAGIVYGYTDPYKDKIPFNVQGFAPGIIVGFGWQFTKNFSMQANLLGAAAMMFQFTWDFR